jgi:hypothetical protein
MALLALPLTAVGYFVRWYASFAEGGGVFDLDDYGT